jgi:hypothetical protein
MKTQPVKTRQVFEYATLAGFLYTYQSLSDEELESYVSFAESDHGRRYHQSTMQAVKEVQLEAALYIGRTLKESLAG